MGVEIVFVLIYPVVLICVPAAIWFWFVVVKAEGLSAIGYIKAFVPLVVGFAVSMGGLALLTYRDCDENFTWLVQHGYYTESQRPVYLPARVVGQAIVNLVFVLPTISFVVVPWTVFHIKTNRLKWVGVALWTVIGWVALSLIGWLLDLAIIIPPYPLIDFLKSTVAPVLLYGLPIPIAALLFFGGKRTA